VISAEISVLRKQINEKGKKTSELEKENQDFKDQVESLQTKLQHA
jgi:peptidoglycan hydrolase CwlO-like protein